MNDDEPQHYAHTDIFVPVSRLQVSYDKIPIIWDGCDATIEGTLHDVGRYYC